MSSSLSLVCFFLFVRSLIFFFFFFFNDTATTEIYTLSLHDALPICAGQPVDGHERADVFAVSPPREGVQAAFPEGRRPHRRSEEHTSELQSLAYLVCRLLLEKKKNITKKYVRVTMKTMCTATSC